VRTYNKCKASGKCSKGVMVRADSANAYVPGIRLNAKESFNAKEMQRSVIHGHTVVAIVSINH
jgi:hypothetical protein